MKNNIQEKLFEEKFKEQYNKSTDLEWKVDTYKLATTTSILAFLFGLTILFPFNLEFIPYTIIFANKVIIPNSIFLTLILLGSILIGSFISIILSVLNKNIHSFISSLLIAIFFLTGAKFLYQENKEIISYIKENKLESFKIHEQRGSQFINEKTNILVK